MRKIKYLILLAVCGIFPALSAGDFSSDFKEYLPIARKLNSGDTTALEEAENIAEHNYFASILLYLVYSRGYCGENINYPKATRYFDLLLDLQYKNSDFRNRELRDVWNKNLVPAAGGVRYVTIKVWKGYSLIDQRIALRGKIPLANCICEQFACTGGVVPRSLYEAIPLVVLSERDQETVKLVEKEVKAMGGWPQRDEVRYITEETGIGSDYLFNYCRQGAEAGALNCKLLYATMLLKYQYNRPQNFDPLKARRLLLSIQPEFEKSLKAGCIHAAKYVDQIKKSLAKVPGKSTPTAKIIALINATRSDSNQNKIYGYLLARRNDHPDCAVYAAGDLSVKNPRKYREILVRAAKEGSALAVRILLRTSTPGDPDRWYYFYVADKSNMPMPYEFKRHDYSTWVMLSYREAFNQNKISNPRKVLKELSGRYKWAKEELVRYFGNEEEDDPDRVKIEISDDSVIKVRQVEIQGRKFYEFNVAQNDQQNYVDIFIKSGRFSYVYIGHSISTSDAWGTAKLENGTIKRFSLTTYDPFGKIPRRIRLNFEPGNKKFTFKIAL